MCSLSLLWSQQMLFCHHVEFQSLCLCAVACVPFPRWQHMLEYIMMEIISFEDFYWNWASCEEVGLIHVEIINLQVYNNYDVQVV